MSELAPQEDQGVLIAISFNNPTATLAQRQLYSDQVFDTFKTFPENDHVF
jgi:multidrug efflux pump